MAVNRLEYNLESGDRDSIRKEVVQLYLSESPGKGKGELCSQYIYTVEKFKQYCITIERPARLNWGFDFTVNIPFPGHLFQGKRKHSNPSHEDVISALQYSQKNHSTAYNHVKSIIRDFYYGAPRKILPDSELGFFRDRNGDQHPIEIILLAIKWLFIEQDITYWNLSGREMLFTELHERGVL